MTAGDVIVGLFPVVTMALAGTIYAAIEYGDAYGYDGGEAVDDWQRSRDAWRRRQGLYAFGKVVALIMAIASGVSIGVTWAP